MKQPNEELVKKHQELTQSLRDAEDAVSKAIINKKQKRKQLDAFEKQYGDMTLKQKGYERYTNFLSTRIPLEQQPKEYQEWYHTLVERNERKRP